MAEIIGAPRPQDAAQDDAKPPQDAPTAVDVAEAARHESEGPDADGSAVPRPDREAARYRRRLRETEADRDDLRARVERLQRAEVERYAGELVQPSAIWASGITLADTLDENGDVDPGRVVTAVDQAAQQLGLALRPRRPKPSPAQRMEAAVFPSSEDDIAAVIRGQ